LVCDKGANKSPEREKFRFDLDQLRDLTLHVIRTAYCERKINLRKNARQQRSAPQEFSMALTNKFVAKIYMGDVVMKVKNCRTFSNTINDSLGAIKQARGHLHRLAYSPESGTDLVTQIYLCEFLLSEISTIGSCVSSQLRPHAMGAENTRIH
jgi:hypothetical protein